MMKKDQPEEPAATPTAYPIEKVRIACLRAALEMRSTQTPATTVISQAQEYEAYVLGTEVETVVSVNRRLGEIVELIKDEVAPAHAPATSK